MDLANEFPLEPGLCYLNHAAVSPWPRRSHDAVNAFAEQNLHHGSLQYPAWLQTEQRLRDRLARIINAPSPDDIALVKNTSEALSFVAYGLDWQPGDNVVTSNQEFPSNRIVWESLARFGVELRQVDLGTAASPEDALAAAIDERTRLLTISSVQYGTGLCMDLERLGSICRDRRILFCVDAIQSIGALSFDVEAIGADFVAADGHKWLLGPEGLGLFYSRPEARERLSLTQFGWHMVDAVGDFERKSWEPAHTARRFECGSPNMLTIHALEASLSLLEDVGMVEVERRVLANSRWLFEQLAAIEGISLLTPSSEGRYGGITTFRSDIKNNDYLFDYLNENNVFCARRGGGVRFSPHFYTPRAVLQQAVARVASFVANG